MALSPSARAHPTRAWTRLAAGILGVQGVSTILYAPFLPPILIDPTIDIPVLGHARLVWLALGGLAVVAAVGVALRRTWGRWLAAISSASSVALVLVVTSSPLTALLAAILPLIVLFVVLRRWPTTPLV